MSQLPSIFRKHVVDRSQKSDLLPFFNVPLIRLRLCANATSSPAVIARSRISYPSGRWYAAKGAHPVLPFRLCSYVLQRRFEVE
jgi:hypothetical protein